MFITDKFVFLHIPKTAGTFVHKTLRELYCPSVWQRKVHSLRRVTGVTIPLFPYQYQEVRKHTARHKIPEACDGSRAIVLAVRNPLDLYVSHFRFNWWRRFPASWFNDVDAVESQFGPLEEFQFPQFVQATICYRRLKEGSVAGRRSLGAFSAESVRYFCQRPGDATAMQSELALLENVRTQMKGVTILRMESLNADLQKFLGQMGFDEGRLRFLDTAGRIYPGKKTRSEGDRWSEYYTPDLAEQVMNAEWMLFSLFPVYRNISL